MIISKLSGKSVEFLKFCIVGVLCTTIDASVFYCTHIYIGYQNAIIFGFLISITINYLLNVLWSFHRKPSLYSVLGVVAANCFNIFVVRLTLMWLFINYASLSEAIAFIPTLLISIFTNFLIVRFLVNRL